MIAGQLTSRGRVELVETPEPTLAAKPVDGEPAQILFQPEMSCLCGSDLPYFNGEHPEMPVFPSPIGYSLHEMVGTVVATNGSRFSPGDRVLAVPVKQRGFFQRYVVSEERAIHWDQRLSPGKAVLAQPFGTVIYAMRKLGCVLDQDVAIVGQGPIGQMFLTIMRNMGARNVYVIDRIPERLQLSAKRGAAACINAQQVDAVAALTELTHGRMVDVVVEAVGHADQVLNLCIDLLRHAGRLLFFGVPPETIDGIRWRELFYKNLTVHSSVNPSFERDFPLAMQWIQEGRVDFSPLVTHHFPLHDVQAAFEVFRDRREGAQKVLLEFPAYSGD